MLGRRRPKAKAGLRPRQASAPNGRVWANRSVIRSCSRLCARGYSACEDDRRERRQRSGLSEAGRSCSGRSVGMDCAAVARDCRRHRRLHPYSASLVPDAAIRHADAVAVSRGTGVKLQTTSDRRVIAVCPAQIGEHALSASSITTQRKPSGLAIRAGATPGMRAVQGALRSRTKRLHAAVGPGCPASANPARDRGSIPAPARTRCPMNSSFLPGCVHMKPR